jgi:ABC-2 type transport system permease protein
MSGNEAFEMVSERGWSRGLSNMINSGLARWFKTRSWWINCLIWGGMIALIVSAIAFNPEPPPLTDLLMIYTVFVGLFPAVGVIIVMQDALVGEKQDGTAAWVLSKPVTRHAFVLSKVISNSVGVLATMVVVPCLIGYAILSIFQKSPLDPLGYLAAMGVIFISHFWFLSLTVMLGTLFSGRAPVIGIPLAILFLQQNLIQYLPFLGIFLPWNLVVPLGNTPSLVFYLMRRLTIPQDNILNLIVIVLESILFISIGLWRFTREEF